MLTDYRLAALFCSCLWMQRSCILQEYNIFKEYNTLFRKIRSAAILLANIGGTKKVPIGSLL
jgi:hypothetical protein